MEFVLKGKSETVFRLIRLMAEGEKLEQAAGRLEGSEVMGSDRAGAYFAVPRGAREKKSLQISATFVKAFGGGG